MKFSTTTTFLKGIKRLVCLKQLGNGISCYVNNQNILELNPEFLFI